MDGQRLKTSLLTDKDDPTSPTERGGQSGGVASRVGTGSGSGSLLGKGGGSRAATAGGGNGDGDGVRGLWDEASGGDVQALASALAPGGGGDVNACMPDGEKERSHEAFLGDGERGGRGQGRGVEGRGRE